MQEARSPKALIGTAPVCPSVFEDTGARGLSLIEVHQLREDFITAAVRAQRAGYDGSRFMGLMAIFCVSFEAPCTIRGQDEYGGTLANRSRLIVEILDGVRQQCGRFLLGLRLSPEHHGSICWDVWDCVSKSLILGSLIFWMSRCGMFLKYLSKWPTKTKPS